MGGKKDQLFKKFISDDLFNKVINSFGLSNLQDTRSFSRKDLKVLKTVNQINALKPDLSECYLPCKSRAYLNGLNEKNVVTVLRQILRTRNYTIVSREKYMQGEKFIIYCLAPLTTKDYNPVINNVDKTQQNSNSPILLTFD